MKKIVVLTVISVYCFNFFAAEDEPVTKEKEAVEVYVPPIGTTHVKPVPEKRDEYEGLLPEDKPSITLGPLEIKRGIFKILPDHKFILTAQASFMGKTAEVGILETSIDKLDFASGISFKAVTVGLRFKDSLTFEVLPGKQITLNELAVTLEKKKPVVMTGTATLFNTKVKVTFEAEQQVTAITLAFPHIALNDLVPETKQSPLLESIELYGVTLKYYVANKSTMITGSAEILGYDVDLTIMMGAAQPEIKEPTTRDLQTFSDSAINYEMSKLLSAQVINLEKQLADRDITTWTKFTDNMRSYFEKNSPVQVQDLFDKASTASFDFVNSIKLVGHLKDKPDQLKTQVQQLESIKKSLNDTESQLKSVSRTIKDENDQLREKTTLDVREENILVQRENALKKLFSFIDFLNIKVNAFTQNATQLADKKPLKKLDPKRGYLMIDGSFKMPQPIKAFKKYNIPYVSDMSFVGASFTVDIGEKDLEVIVTGDTVLFNLPLKAKIRYKTDEKKQPMLLLQAALPNEWKVSDVDKKFEDTIFDQLAFENINVIVATKDYYDRILDVPLKRGLNFYGKVYLKGPLSPFTHLLKQSVDTAVPVFFGIATNPLESVIHIGFEGKSIKLSKKAFIEKFAVEIAGMPKPTVSLLGMTNILIDSEEEPLHFISRLSFGATSALLAGTLMGTWHNPFKIKGLDLTNVALQAGMDFKLLVTTGIPIETIGLTGQMDISKYTVKVAGNFSVTQAERLVLSGELNRLMLEDLTDAARSWFKAKIPTDTIPDVGFQDITLYLSSGNTKIGEIAFEQGMTFAGTLILPILKAKAYVHLAKNGWIGTGYTSPLKLGPILITGQSADKKAEGLSIDLYMTPARQEVYMNALITADPVFKLETIVYFKKTEIMFKGETKITDSFKAIIEGRAALTKNPEVRLLIDLESDFNDYVSNALRQELSKFQKISNRAIKKAQNDVRTLDNNIADIDTKLKAKRSRFVELMGKATDERLDPLRKEVAKWQAKWNRVPPNKRILRTADIGVPLSTTRASLEIAEGLLKTKEAIKVENEIVELEIQKFGLKLAREVAYGVLEAARQTAEKSAEGLKIAIKHILETVQVKHARFEGSAHDILKGVLPALTLDITVLGKQHKLDHLFFDIRHPKESALSVAKQLLNFIIKTEMPEAKESFDIEETNP